MRFSLALLSGLLAATVSGLAVPTSDAETGSVALAEREEMLEIRADSSDADILKSSALDFATNEDAVSTFLDLVASGGFRNQKAYQKAAKKAYRAQKKAVLDYDTLGQYLDGDQVYSRRNSTLYDAGALGHTTSLLHELTTLSWTNDQSDIQDIVNQINFGGGGFEGRCDAIPAIDDVLGLASDELLDLSPGDISLEGLTVAAPKACTSSTKREVLYG